MSRLLNEATILFVRDTTDPDMELGESHAELRFLPVRRVVLEERITRSGAEDGFTGGNRHHFIFTRGVHRREFPRWFNYCEQIFSHVRTLPRTMRNSG